MHQWKLFLARFFRFPLRLITQPRLLIYFVVFVVVFGGLGTWISYAQFRSSVPGVDQLSVYRNFATYLIAIAVTAVADQLVRKQGGDNRTLILALFALALFSCIASILILVVGDMKLINTCATVGASCAGILWLVANDDNENLVESDALSTLGGTV
jgi:hypothetical protein